MGVRKRGVEKCGQGNAGKKEKEKRGRKNALNVPKENGFSTGVRMAWETGIRNNGGKARE
jgi:hypothetical protein